VTGGQAGFSAPYGDVGGGILNAGQVAVVESSVRDNASSSSGGGIYNLGTVTLTSSSVGGNTTGSVRFQYTTHWSLVPSPHGPQNSCWFATLASHIRLKRASDCHHSPHGG